MIILDRLPIHREPILISVQGEALQVWRNQVIVWLSINDPRRPFAAILDTGHSHSLALTRRQFDRWSGAKLKQIGESKVGLETIPQFAADVHIHKNHRGRHELTGVTVPLKMDQGVSIIPDDSKAAPRLPLLGMRTIVNNDLRLIIDGKRRTVTLESAALRLLS